MWWFRLAWPFSKSGNLFACHVFSTNNLYLRSFMSQQKSGGYESLEQMSSKKSAWLVTGLGAVAFTALYLFIYHLQSMNKSAAALAMKDAGMQDMHKFWAFPVLQASGLVGLVVSFLVVLLGLQQSRRAVKWLKLDYRTIDQLHRQMALLALGLVIVHAVATAFDAMGDSWHTAFFVNAWAGVDGFKAWSGAVLAYDLGIIGFYIFLLLGPTFYLRRKMGVQRWKFLHRFILAFYIVSVWHALMIGKEFGYYGWLRPVTWLAQIPLLLLLAKRFSELATKNKDKKSGIRYLSSIGLVAISYLGILAALVLVLSGHSGFIAMTG
jgi:predicted ferric reductase